MDGWAGVAASGFLYAIGVGVIGAYVRNIKRDVIDLLDRQFRSCEQRLRALDESDRYQWKAIDSHGHKGLDENGGRVVRG